VGYIYIVVSFLSKKMPCLAAEVRFLHFFLCVRTSDRGFDPPHGTTIFIRTQTIDRQSTHNRHTIQTIQKFKHSKIAFQINPCILLLSAPRKRLSNNRTRKHTLASLCFYFQLVHIPITTSFFFTFKPKQSFHIICLHLEKGVDSGYLLQVSDQKYKSYISFRYKTTTNIIFLKASILILFLFLLFSFSFSFSFSNVNKNKIIKSSNHQIIKS
jgi:hypothetical protein